MQVNYYKEWSDYLSRHMEFKVYGHAGRPMMVFPCQSGRFWDWEDQGMVEIAKPWIEDGKLQLFCIDSIDPESWDCPNGDPHYRMQMHEKWYNYLTCELYPRMIELNGDENYGKVITTGSSMGGSHAVNFFLRRPDLFNGVISLSGLFDMKMFIGDYMDDIAYMNVPVVYMANFPADHPYIEKFNNADPLIICVGQGAWEDEMLESTVTLKQIFERKGIKADWQIWGQDVNHDWPWWRIQWPMFLSRVLDK